MLQWLTQRRVMGGLVFGAPGWAPSRIENTFEEMPAAGGAEGVEGAARAVAAPADRAGLLRLLEGMGMGRTSGVIPSLVDQVRDLGGRKDVALRAMVLCLLPTQPEFALAAALSRLALDDIRVGLAALQQSLAPRWVLAVADRHEHGSVQAWRQVLKGCGGRVVCILNRYPQAHPSVLLRRLFGSRLPVQALPTAVGCVVMDPVACWAVGRYLRTGRALRDRPVQVFVQNSREHAAHLVMGRIGETLEAMCARYGISAAASSPPLGEAATQVIINGVMAGQEVDAALARVETWTEAVAVRERPATENPVACLECGWCVDVCPTGLTPVRLMELARRAGAGASAEALPREAAESQHCIGCGLCSYVCPSRLPLASETLRLQDMAGGRRQPGPQPRVEGDR